MKASKLYTSLLLAILFTSTSLAQYTSEHYGLKGNVKEVSTTVYRKDKTYDEDSISKKKWPIPPTTNRLYFDTIGRLTYQLENNFYHTFYRYKSNTALPVTISSNNKVISIKYDHLNQKISETESRKYPDTINFHDVMISEVKKTNITYDSNTNTEYQTVIALPEGRKIKEIVSIYDQDGCKIKECLYTYDTIFSENKTLCSSISFIYDTESNLLQYIQYTYDDEGVNTRTIGNYNKHGKLKNEISYTSDEFPFRTTKIEYDKHNNITKKTITFAEYDETFKTSYSYKYKYDKYGNWISMEFFCNEKLYSSTERRISYYNE